MPRLRTLIKGKKIRITLLLQASIADYGCLQKGDEPDEFSITGEDGKTYGLRSSAVDLSKHLGHKVAVTGNLKAESYEKEKGENEEHEKKEAGDIRVTNLKMVTDTCK